MPTEGVRAGLLIEELLCKDLEIHGCPAPHALNVVMGLLLGLPYELVKWSEPAVRPPKPGVSRKKLGQGCFLVPYWPLALLAGGGADFQGVGAF